MLKRFLFAFFAFIGLIVPAAFALALMAAPPASPAPLHLPGCDRNLADAGTNVAAMQARLKGLDAKEGKDICSATRLYFLEVVRRAPSPHCAKAGRNASVSLAASMPMWNTSMRRSPPAAADRK